jgi:hypothetical protein
MVNVRFTPESGHVRCNEGCPLWANSGHSCIGPRKLKDRIAAVSAKPDLGVLLRRQKPPPPRQDGDHNDYRDCDP